MSATRERIAELVREAIAEKPIPEGLDDLDADSRRQVERAAEVLGVSPQEYLDRARRAQDQAAREDRAADAVVAAVRQLR